MVNLQTEIRKLPSAHTGRLIEFLDECDSWIDLIEIIPDENGDYKYNSNHKRLIEEEAKMNARSCSEILLDEWGISGRRRPTVGFLLDLLIKANLYRAADYVSQELLNGGPVPRPTDGPAARVDIVLPNVSKSYGLINNKYNEEKVLTKQVTCLQSGISNTSELQIGNIPEDLFREVEHSEIGSYDKSNSIVNANGSFANYLPNFKALEIFPGSIQNTANLSESRSVNGDGQNNQSNQIINNSEYLNSNIGIPNLSEFNMNNSNSERTASINTSFANINLGIPCYSYEELKTRTDNFNESSCKIGSGAFGSVYLASGAVAVKKLHSVNVDNTSQYKNEIEVMSKCKHKNLLELLGYSIDGPTYCLVYEYMPGGCLKDRLLNQNKVLGAKTRIEIAVGCADGIAYLHSIPIIHRDIKSANILLDHMDQPKLSDFGLIKRTEMGASSVQATTISGTSAYMSPEAHRGDISTKMDCYSFGVVLLELITGLAPLDVQREDRDLVTHVYTHITKYEQNGIDSLVDKRIDLWLAPARELYSVAADCLLEKWQRPYITDILPKLSEIKIV